MKTYLDTSALAKLIVPESESQKLRDYLDDKDADMLFTAALTRTELIRVARRIDAAAVTAARSILSGLTMVHLTAGLLDAAANLDPPLLRSLDAIHLAAAQRAGSDLRAVITYDTRMAEAAESLALPVLAPC
ncbi:MAG TPA: type II toxin-antitoxin system VapC family toxin [Mycobacterium sp.]|nr:type II toxin-antitoxin system VapC family toxin [Mycobacterium sp.]HQC78674.1 type II toxin-antitoxin system VapC family toxin [Mycobacterium sp.]